MRRLHFDAEHTSRKVRVVVAQLLQTALEGCVWKDVTVIPAPSTPEEPGGGQSEEKGQEGDGKASLGGDLQPLALELAKQLLPRVYDVATQVPEQVSALHLFDVHIVLCMCRSPG